MPLDPVPEWAVARQRAIGDRIRAARIGVGLSQVELGERVGRDHKTIHRWESAKTVPNLLDLLLVAAALDMLLPDLVR